MSYQSGSSLGYVLGRWLHTRPWLMVAGVFVGYTLGFTYVVLVVFAGTRRARGRGTQGDQDGGTEGRSP